MKIKYLNSFLVFTLLLFFPVKYSAQLVGVSLTGVVADANGAVVVGARVDLISAQQANLAGVTTDARGRFTFEKLAPGVYEVKVTQTGFSPQRVSARMGRGAGEALAVTLNVNQIAEDVVTSAITGQAESTDGVSQAINVIPEESIQQRATGVLAQVADEEVGVSLQRTSPTIGAIVIRGLTGKNVANYVDGVRYTNSAQRGGINTFLNLNEPSSIRAVEILRGPNGAQFGSDSLGGAVNLLTRTAAFGGDKPQTHGEFNTFYTSADNSFGGNTLLTYGTKRVGLLVNPSARRVNTLRSADGLDGHAAVTRFLGLPSNIFGDRLPDTAFTQYGGNFKLNYAATSRDQFIFSYQRGQQDGGKRYDQTLGGDGNRIAELRNLMNDLFYARYLRSGGSFFDNASLTFSFNSLREERVNQGGQGNFTGDITHQYERTRAIGYNAYFDKRLGERNTLLAGSDYYHERIKAPSFIFRPSNATLPIALARPRVPDNARYDLFGAYVQDVLDLVPNRARLSAAFRYNAARYRVRSADNVIVNNVALVPNDFRRVDDFSGRVGLVLFTDIEGLTLAFNYSRGFRAPNVTDLGTLGLTGDGFEADFASASALGGRIGSTAGPDAVSTGLPIEQINSEISNNFDASVRYRRSRFDTDFTFFVIDINKAIVKQALILPQGATGRFLGSTPITGQNTTTGAVFVAASANPVLIRANFTDAREYGFEYTLETRLSHDFTFAGNFTYYHAEDKATGAPPNIEGGTPPATGFMRLRYQPVGKRYWVEAYSTLAYRLTRLSSLDLNDRRTGALRTRGQIANFFNRGARVRGLINAGPDGITGNGDDRLTATNETVAQIQNRLLGTAPSGLLYDHLPGYGLFNVRGGVRFGEHNQLTFDFENIADQAYRGVSWGIDGPGRSITARYQYRF